MVEDMSDPRRFEIRCTPEIRELAEALCAIEGDKASTLVRRLIVAHARDILPELESDERTRLRKLLTKVAEAS